MVIFGCLMSTTSSLCTLMVIFSAQKLHELCDRVSEYFYIEKHSFSLILSSYLALMVIFGELW